MSSLVLSSVFFPCSLGYHLEVFYSGSSSSRSTASLCYSIHCMAPLMLVREGPAITRALQGWSLAVQHLPHTHTQVNATGKFTGEGAHKGCKHPNKTCIELSPHSSGECEE